MLETSKMEDTFANDSRFSRHLKCPLIELMERIQQFQDVVELFYGCKLCGSIEDMYTCPKTLLAHFELNHSQLLTASVDSGAQTTEVSEVKKTKIKSNAERPEDHIEESDNTLPAEEILNQASRGTVEKESLAAHSESIKRENSSENRGNDSTIEKSPESAKSKAYINFEITDDIIIYAEAIDTPNVSLQDDTALVKNESFDHSTGNLEIVESDDENNDGPNDTSDDVTENFLDTKDEDKSELETKENQDQNDGSRISTRRGKRAIRTTTSRRKRKLAQKRKTNKRKKKVESEDDRDWEPEEVKTKKKKRKPIDIVEYVKRKLEIQKQKEETAFKLEGNAEGNDNENTDNEDDLFEELIPDCPICNITCKNQEGWLHHYKKYHPEIKLFGCTYCNETFATRRELRGHRKTFNHYPVKCYLCKQMFKTREELKEHKLNHPRQMCEICGDDFIDLKQHMVHHNLNDEAFKCQTCGKVFNTQYKLNRHMKIHAERKDFQCSMCVKQFRTKSQLYAHETQTHRGAYKCTCQTCGAVLKSRSNLRIHELKHTSARPYVCEFCGANFKDPSNLRRHRLIHEERQGPTCDTCGMKFRDGTALASHRLVHSGEKNFVCNQCGKKFARKDVLQTHERIHTGEMPYKCTICNRQFRHKSSFYSHRKQHTINGGCSQEPKSEGIILVQQEAVNYTVVTDDTPVTEVKYTIYNTASLKP